MNLKFKPNLSHVGSYAYVSYGNNVEVEDTAWLTDTTMENKGGGCLQFWYHMYGEHVGTLDVFSSVRGRCAPQVPNEAGFLFSQGTAHVFL